jgi:molybdopterin/thiamine biosynthesis adenylyltransferase
VKGVVWERVDGMVRVVYDLREQLLIDDPDGTVTALLERLREGGRTPAELAAVLSTGRDPVTVEDVHLALAQLDEYRLVEDGTRLDRLSPAEAERHFSNLAFFESFATLARSREDICRDVRDAHVLVLGAGGLNSNTIPHLCGLGVGRLTIVDRDTVEARNFARQYLYRWTDRGVMKAPLAAEWVRAFDPSIKVDAVVGGVGSSEDVADLLDRYAPDAVASGIDDPLEVDRWVNAACVTRGVPFVRGGIWVTEGVVWSVDPGRSPCLECALRSAPAETGQDELATERAGVRLHATKPRTNRGIGPVAGLLGALGAFELLRYLTRFEPPAYAAHALLLDFAAGCATRREAWARDPSCPCCADVGVRPAIGEEVNPFEADDPSHRERSTHADV